MVRIENQIKELMSFSSIEETKNYLKIQIKEA